jgi:hypothetical protein
MSEPWMTGALCAWFPSDQWIVEPEDRSAAAEAALRAVCRACRVRVDCEAFVSREGIVSGFWAGLDRSPQDEPARADGAA